MTKQKIRIRLKAFDYKLIDTSAAEIVDTALAKVLPAGYTGGLFGLIPENSLWACGRTGSVRRLGGFFACRCTTWGVSRLVSALSAPAN